MISTKYMWATWVPLDLVVIYLKMHFVLKLVFLALEYTDVNGQTVLMLDFLKNSVASPYTDLMAI